MKRFEVTVIKHVTIYGIEANSIAEAEEFVRNDEDIANEVDKSPYNKVIAKYMN